MNNCVTNICEDKEKIQKIYSNENKDKDVNIQRYDKFETFNRARRSDESVKAMIEQ